MDNEMRCTEDSIAGFPGVDGQLIDGLILRRELRGHKAEIFGLAWSPQGQVLASGSKDTTICIWDAGDGTLRQTLTGHKRTVLSLSFSPDGALLASGSVDETVKLWDTASWQAVASLEGHSERITSVAFGPDGTTLVSASDDGKLIVWDVRSGKPIRVLTGHQSFANCAAYSVDGKIASAGLDGTARMWDGEVGEKLGGRNGVEPGYHAVAFSRDGRLLAAGGDGKVIQIFDAERRSVWRTLEGHTGSVMALAFSFDDLILASKSQDGTFRLWSTSSWEPIGEIAEHSTSTVVAIAFHPSAPLLATFGEEQHTIRIWGLDTQRMVSAAQAVHYVNAKAVLVGESGVGKSGLGIRMVEKSFQATASTHGARFWQIPVELPEMKGPPVRAEITLWDLAGQSDYHIVHQLFIDDCDIALLLFDCSDPNNPFRGVPYWAKVLAKQASSRAIRLLVSSRTDVSPPTVNQQAINKTLALYGLDRHFATSAKTGQGVAQLLAHVVSNVPWDDLPTISTSRVFHVIREVVLQRKGTGGTLIAAEEVAAEVRRRFPEQSASPAAIDTVVSVLQSRGLVRRLALTPSVSLILLRPEMLNQYASSILLAARNHPRGVGAIAERDIVCAQFPMPGVDRLVALEEKTVLESTVELLIEHGLCFREMGMLVFPSQLNASAEPADAARPRTDVVYELSGCIEAIYASLVVRLSYTDFFQRNSLSRSGAEFLRGTHRLGFTVKQIKEESVELALYFDPEVGQLDRVTFIRFVSEHIRAKGINIQERVCLHCPQCKEEVTDIKAIEHRIQHGERDIPCQYCRAAVSIYRTVEERYQSDQTQEKTQCSLQKKATERTAREIVQFKADKREYTMQHHDGVKILHLSDIHVGTDEEARIYRVQLEADLKQELGIRGLDYLVITGDISNRSTPEEYAAAFELVDGLVKRFGLDESRVVIVPGNHDLNWDLSENAYRFVLKGKLTAPPLAGCYIQAGDKGVLLRDDERYAHRFDVFSEHFYKRVYCGVTYPSSYSEQAILFRRPEEKILFLALNSAWEIDHEHRARASIHEGALSTALGALLERDYGDWLKIAVWHHPVTGPEAMNADFLEQLVIHKFHLCLHGHVHEAREGLYKYDDRRQLHIVGAGTFGASAREQVTGIPLQYNLLTVKTDRSEVKIETRKKEKPLGAWSADARWGDKNAPLPHYRLRLGWR